MKRRIFLKQLGVAASLPVFGRAALANAQSPPPNKSVHKILSCNVRVDVPDDSKTGNGWKHRREMCADIIKAQKADLIGLQEGQAAHLDYLKERMPEYDSYALSHAVDYFHPINAIMYLRSRYELVSCGGFWFSETPHIAASKSWDTANPRLANWVDLKERSSGKIFRYWNTHFDHRGQKAREQAALMVVQACAALPANFPQILSGDMNANIKNPAIKNLVDGGWVDTYAAVHGPKDPGFTAHGFQGTNYPEKNSDGATKLRIDWIFGRGPVNAISAAIIRDGRDGKFPSDHFFVSAEVAIV